MRLNALFRLAFATAPPPGLTSPHATNSQAHSSKGTPSPTQTQTPVRLRRIVGERFQVLFHSPPGVLFIIPSRYYPLSVTREYSGLPGGPGRFTAHSTSALLLGNHDHNPCDVFAYGALTHYGRPSQKRSTKTTQRPSEARQSPYVTPPHPRIRTPCRVSHEHGLATIRFRSPLLTESQLFSLPVGTEMFHFPTFPPHT